MKFIAKERKTIDAIRWDGANTYDVDEFCAAIGKSCGHALGGDDDVVILRVDNGRGYDIELWAITLHGEVEIEPGSWAAYGGTDVYPLDDGELHRLYDEEAQ